MSRCKLLPNFSAGHCVWFRLLSHELRTMNRHISTSPQYFNVKTLASCNYEPALTFCHHKVWRMMRKSEGVKCAVTVRAASSLTAAWSSASGSADTVEDVCQRYHALLTRGEFHPQSFARYAEYLCRVVHARLGWLPWLYNENPSLSHLQIMMNGRFEDLLSAPLYGVQHFRDIHGYISDNCDSIPHRDSPAVLLSLLLSGLRVTDPLVGRLLQRSVERLGSLDMEHLQSLAAAWWVLLQHKDFTVMEAVLNRLKEILSADLAQLDFDVGDLCRIQLVMRLFMSSDLSNRCVAAVLYQVEEQRPLHLDTLLTFLRYAQKMNKMKGVASCEHMMEMKGLAKRMIEDLSDEDVGRMQCWQLGTICQNARRLGIYNGPVVHRLKQRSEHLLRSRGDKQLHDITSLLLAFNAHVSPEFKQGVHSLLMEHLKDADVLTLYNLTDVLENMRISHPKVIDLFRQQVLLHLHNIAEYTFCLSKILMLLVTLDAQHPDPQFNGAVSQVLLKLLSERQGLSSVFVAAAACFMLPCTQEVIPAVLMERLGSVIPRCDIPLLMVVLRGLDRIKGPLSKLVTAQVLEVHQMLCQNMNQVLATTCHTEQLAMLIKGLHRRVWKRDYQMLELMMSHLPPLTKTMTLSDFTATLSVFKVLKPYYYPQVFEDLMNYARSNSGALQFDTVLDLVTAISSAAYHPSDLQGFTQLALQAVGGAGGQRNPGGQVRMAYCLSLLQIFPQPLLERVFSVQFLQEVDEILQVITGEERDTLGRELMLLNRSVALECPNLDVPWFHQQYYRQQAQQQPPLLTAVQHTEQEKRRLFASAVEPVLHEALGEGSSIQCNVYSPYYHQIDFEVVLDGEGEVMSAADVRELSPDHVKHQRVALMLVGNRELCCNNYRRQASFLQLKRQLQILGYRVEEISNYDWNSMLLSDRDSKVKYLHDKVYGNKREQLSSPLPSPTTMHPYWR